MKAAMSRMAGRADGKMINVVAKELLSGPLHSRPDRQSGLVSMAVKWRNRHKKFLNFPNL